MCYSAIYLQIFGDDHDAAHLMNELTGAARSLCVMVIITKARGYLSLPLHALRNSIDSSNNIERVKHQNPDSRRPYPPAVSFQRLVEFHSPIYQHQKSKITSMQCCPPESQFK